MSNTYDLKSPEADVEHEVPVTHLGGLKVPNKTWYKDPGLRSLYKWMPVLMLGLSLSVLPSRDVEDGLMLTLIPQVRVRLDTMAVF